MTASKIPQLLHIKLESPLIPSDTRRSRASGSGDRGLAYLYVYKPEKVRMPRLMYSSLTSHIILYITLSSAKSILHPILTDFSAWPAPFWTISTPVR